MKYIIIALTLLLCSCDSLQEAQKYHRWVKTLKAGDSWNPDKIFFDDGTITIQSSTESEITYRLFSGVDGDVFICVKNGVVVSTWIK